MRALGGKAGWNGLAAQLGFAAILAWIAYEIVANARTNLETQHIASGFGFLNYNAGFDVNQSLIAYNNSDTYWRVFFVGLLNTLVVSVIGIFFATLIGFAMIWHIWWMMLIGVAGAFATFVAFAWRDRSEVLIPAAEVAALDRANRAARTVALSMPRTFQ